MDVRNHEGDLLSEYGNDLSMQSNVHDQEQARGQLGKIDIGHCGNLLKQKLLARTCMVLRKTKECVINYEKLRFTHN